MVKDSPSYAKVLKEIIVLEQLKKAGLVSEQKAKKAKRQQYQKKKQQKSQKKQSTSEPTEAAQLVAEAAKKKAEHEHKILLEQQRLKTEKENQAQLQQILNSNQLKGTEGELTYQFADHRAVKTLFVNHKTRQGLMTGRIRIAKQQNAYILVPEEVVEKIEQRDKGVLIPLAEEGVNMSTEDEAYYAKFAIPDDLIW